MTEFSLGMAVELLVAVLLVVTIGYCMLLNQRLTRLRADEAVLRATIGELLSATEVAERAINGLKQAAVDCDRTLGVRMKAAESMITALQAQLQIAERYSQEQLRAAEPPPPVRAPQQAAAARPQPPQIPAASAQQRAAPQPPLAQHRDVSPRAPAPAARPAVAAPARAQGHPLDIPYGNGLYDGVQAGRQMMPPPQTGHYPPAGQMPPPAPAAAYPQAPASYRAPPAYGAAPQQSAARNVQAAAAEAAERLKAYRRSGSGEAA